MSLPLVLATIFIVLKLVGTIAWPWVWILAPIWISLMLAVVIFCILWSILGTDKLEFHLKNYQR